ncbi:unnamed protein product [Prorocentrum cordatum]|uniref:Uncharacterized protein n=1 Tax=Prorocentrum cordatum TaxID=2364126 RepID=A0ABN9W6N2_9DINO|nr:unnamed protein product [Polarella glacialis]
MTFVLSFAVGPLYTLWDFMKGTLCTALASLIVQKPNFTQFGELADYVYCTYCSALYLERVAHDRGRHGEADEPEPDEDLEPCLHEASASGTCPWQCAAFLLLFTGLPCLAAALVDRSSAALGYPCPAVVGFLPLRACAAAPGASGTEHGGAGLWRLAELLPE